ncbi:MAG: serine hydrolase [Isosphaera sp.]|nr:serine hydrolase [Isosphaera sp.]
MRTRAAACTTLVALFLAPRGMAQEPWPTTKPADVRLDAKVLAEWDADLAKGKYGYIDSITIVRHGKIAFDRTYRHDYDKIYGERAKNPGPQFFNQDPAGPFNYFNPFWHPYYRRGDLHYLASVNKFITAVVIGTAVTRKEFPDLDTPVMKYFDPKKVENPDKRKDKITIRHLLTMTAGLEWRSVMGAHEEIDTNVEMENSFDWVAFTINRKMADEPGKVFNYCPGATMMLAHIFRKATGKDLEEYAVEHLFKPLGIEDYFWKRAPNGLVDAEGGLYLRPHDLARFGYLYLKKGVRGGKQIVSEDWIKESVKPHVDAKVVPAQYGYQCFISPHKANDPRLAYGSGGFGGQGLWVFPNCDAVLVVTGWNLLEDKPRLEVPEAMDRFLRAVTDLPADGAKK